MNSKIYDSAVPDYTKHTEPYFDEHKKEVNAALAQYNKELHAVKLKVALQTATRVSSIGNKLLQDNKIDNKLATEQPDKCAAVVGLALNQIHFLASLIEPYMPATSALILEQLNMPLLIIPDLWEANSIKPNHKIGQVAHLFGVIKPEKEEWRELLGGEEARKAKAEKEAAKKAEKERKKATKAAANGGGAKGESVEAIEKGGKETLPGEKTAVEKVSEGVKQVVLQSS